MKALTRPATEPARKAQVQVRQLQLRPWQARQWLVCLGILLLSSVLLAAPLAARDNAEHFPVPEVIKPAIAFWIKVYTEADTNSGFLHDSRDLSVIYEKLPRDTKLIEARRKTIIADLEVLAGGKREALSEQQQKLLALWGANTDNARFRLAAQNVRWQLGQSDRYREGLVRSGAYRQHIADVIDARQLPQELGILPHVESSFHPGAFSSVAASGMWQFMRETATRFMRVDLVVDERLDPYTSAEAAMELLEYNYSRLGTWPLALTAYNHGTAGMARAVRDSGTSDIGQIISEYSGPRFGFASRNFYPQFLAALEVDTHAERYFGVVEMDSAPDFVSVELGGYVEAGVIAASLGVDLATLRRYNPALLAPVWNGSKRIPKGYRLKLDRSAYPVNLQAGLDSIPAANFHSAQIPDVSYKVQSGDSLSRIASRFNTSVSELATINQLRDRHQIRVGQTLVLPQQNGAMPTLVVNNDSAPAARPDQQRYEVRPGDTISTIARRFGVGVPALLALNGLDERGLIQPGQQLQLRPESNSAAARVLASDNTPGRDLDVAMQAAARQELRQPASNLQVVANARIEVQTDETLGHFADWLQVSSATLRQLNGLNSTSAVRVGQALQLDFSKVSPADFEARRRSYHDRLQERYFASWRIRETENYSIRQRDLLTVLARERSLPLWLIAQYNPGVDVSQLQIGQVLVFPIVEKIAN